MLTLTKSYKLHYKMQFQGMPISIENDKGTYREWKDDQGNSGMTFMAFPYGYINLTEGTDGDHVDVYIGPHSDSRRVFVVHQNVPETGEYDEDKCMLGFNNAEDAKGAYLYQYDDPKFFGDMDEYDIDTFKQLLKERKGMKIKNDNLEKAKAAPIGTIRDWKGGKYRKTADGWKPVKKEKKPVKDVLDGFPKTKGNLNSAGVPYQPTKDMDKLYKMVEEMAPEFHTFVTNLANALGVESVKMRKKLKSRNRVNVKVKEDYGGDVSRILDINGGTLIFKDEAGIDRLRETVKHLRPPILRIKDRFKKPAPGGYRDYMANVTMPNGVIVEILATTEGIMREKSSGIGHKIYEIIRSLPPDPKFTGLTDSLLQLSEHAYSAAAANSSARSSEIGIEFNKILPVLAGSIGSLLPDEVIEKNWFPTLATGTSSQSKYDTLSDIVSSINSINSKLSDNKVEKSIKLLIKSSRKEINVLKVKIVRPTEVLEKSCSPVGDGPGAGRTGRNPNRKKDGTGIPIGTREERDGKIYEKFGKDDWREVSGAENSVEKSVRLMFFK